ncbi:MAG: RHS repeat protein [Proteobacteria bacterium]|nr:RHS repeat protein [Pseudomonadota bacterium]
MKKALTTILFLALCSSNVLAQNDEYLNANLVPNVATPSVAELGKHISVPVSLNTGTPNISIPLYTLEYGGMQVPITLSYDATGVRVSEMANFVGLKWNLNVGGALTRIVKGGADEGTLSSLGFSPIQCLGYYLSYGLSNYAPYFNANYTDTFSMGVANSNFYQELVSGYRDAEPDLFSFNALNHTGRFYFNENREVVPYLNKDYIIKEFFGGAGLFNKWEVTSPNGIQMTFGENNAIEKSYSHEVGNYTNLFITRSWFLNQLKNNRNNKVISFQYEKEEYSETTANNNSRIGCINTLEQPGITTPACYGVSGTTVPSCGFFDTSSFFTTIESENSIITNRIKTITAGDFRVEFIASNRDDLYSIWNDAPKKIDEIIVYQGQTCVKRFQLEYGYFVSTASSSSEAFLDVARTDKGKKRLKLLKVKEVSCSNNILKEYAFEYHEEYSLPQSTSFAQDKWGFYNGKDTNRSLFPRDENSCSSSTTFSADRDVNLIYSRLGTLKKIVYPTGGASEFVYENHVNDEIVDPGSNGGWVNQLTVGGFGQGNGQAYKEYIINQQGSYKVGLTLYMGNSYPGDSATSDTECLADEMELAFEIIDLNTSAVISSYTYDDLVPQSGSNYMKSYDPILFNGNNIKIRTYYTYNSSGNQCMSAGAILYKLTALPPTAADYVVGGLRVKEIKFIDTDNTIVKTNTYTYETPNLIDNPKYVYNLSWNIDLSYNGLIDLYNINNTNEFYFMHKVNVTFSSGSFDLITPASSPQQIDFMGSHISYDKVTEVNSEGKTEYSYYPAKTYFELSGFSSSDVFPFPPLLQSNKSGKLLAKRTYDKLNQIVTERIDIYTDSTDWNNETKAMSVSNIMGYNIYPHIFYSLYPEYLSLQSTTTKQFLSGQEVSTTTNYFYEGNGHNQTTKVVTTNSLGEQLESRSLYAPDVNNTTLIAQNRIVPPIETTTYNDTQILQKQTTNFSTSGSLYLPSSVDVTKGTGIIETRVLYEKYDSNGNLLQYRKTNGSPISFIWGYNGQYPIAKVENATYADIEALSSFGTNFTIVNNLSTTQEAALRGLSNTLLVTTYVYSPLVGITSVTDPKGYTTSFEYDEFNRLKQVKDADGKILSENNYHYKGQQ